MASTLEPPLPKEKGTEPSVQSSRSWGGESQGGQEPHLGDREKDQSGSIKRKWWSGKGGLHSDGRQIPRKRERARKKSHPRRGRGKHERMSGCKSSPES